MLSVTASQRKRRAYARLPRIEAKVLAELGAVDILVSNAATVESAGPTATAGPEDWARAVAVNLTGPVPGKRGQPGIEGSVARTRRVGGAFGRR